MRPTGAPASARTIAPAAAAAGNRAFARLVGRGPTDSAKKQGRRSGLLRFGSEEHRQLGERASGGATLDITLDDGSPLTYGQMVSLAGDYFGSLGEMQKLLESDEGKKQIRYARFWSLQSGNLPADSPQNLNAGSEQGISEDTKKKVRDRYFKLASENFSHFSAGGTAEDNYEKGHADALSLAFRAGAECSDRRWNEAMTSEAFCQHYLSDMFSAGHVRTPRMEMKEWYADKFPGSLDNIVAFMAEKVTDTLDSWGEPSWFSIFGYGVGPRKWIVRRQVRQMITELGGEALKTFSLGDIVALAYHNQDNKALNVVSEVDPQGNPVPDGYRWTGTGDGHLHESQTTRDMAVAAMQKSLSELNELYAAGEQASARVGLVFPPSALAAQMKPYFDGAMAARSLPRAKQFVPHEVTGPNSGNDTFNWKWGELDPVLRSAVDETIAGDIAGELRNKAAEVGDKETGIKEVYGMTVHARDAVLKFCTYLQTEKTRAIEDAIGMNATVAGLPPWEPRDAGVDDIPGGVPESPDAGVPGSPDAGVPAGAAGSQ
jgi:hypothetical protein